MNIEINYAESVTEDTSHDLRVLSDTIVKNCDTQIQIIRQIPETGQKDAGLILGLTIASLAFSAIDTLINVLTYWQSQRTKYSVSFSIKGKKYSLESHSLKDIKTELLNLQQTTNPKVKILIEKK
jgi:hypothetical protein